MRGAIRFGRLLGIELAFDLSWLLILLLMIWNLAAVFTNWHPDWAKAVVVAEAVVAALLFFGSVLVHELAHSLVARAYGIPVRRITLFLLGGVSNIEREPGSPKAELFMAAVGPLTSIVLGVVFLAASAVQMRTVVGVTSGDFVASPRDVLGQLGPIATLFAWLGPINLLVGAFNLIPGFPLDGGRILRSILWSIQGDFRRATQWASYVGQAVGWSFIVVGVAMAFGAVVPIFGTGLLGALWLMFIGWFLTSAARQSYSRAVVQELLSGIPVSRLMRPSGVTVPPDLTVSDLVNHWFMRSEDRAFPVVRGPDFLGLVCLDDVRKLTQEIVGDHAGDVDHDPDVAARSRLPERGHGRGALEAGAPRRRPAPRRPRPKPRRDAQTARCRPLARAPPKRRVDAAVVLALNQRHRRSVRFFEATRDRSGAFGTRSGERASSAPSSRSDGCARASDRAGCPPPAASDRRGRRCRSACG